MGNSLSSLGGSVIHHSWGWRRGSEALKLVAIVATSLAAATVRVLRLRPHHGRRGAQVFLLRRVLPFPLEIMGCPNNLKTNNCID